MEHPQHSNRAIFPNMPNITDIFMDHVEDIKNFELGPSATISNLAFRIELMLKLTDKKVLMDGTSSTLISLNFSEYSEHHREFYGPCGGHQELNNGTKCDHF